MTVAELKEVLNTLDDDMELVIQEGDVFWPICYEDSGFVEAETSAGELSFYMLAPCKGHDDVPPVEFDYIPNEEEITLN